MGVTTDADTAKCLTVPEGEQRVVSLKFTPSDKGRGRVTGTIPVEITPARGKPVTRNVPVVIEMSTPNWAVRAGAVLIGILLSLLISYLVLRVTNYMVARFERPGLLRFAQFEVTIHAEEPFIRRDGEPDTALVAELRDLDDIAYSSSSGKSPSPRSFEKNGLEFAAKAGNRELLSGPTGTVRSRSSRALGGALIEGDRLGTDASYRVATLPLGLTSLWVFELNALGPGVEAAGAPAAADNFVPLLDDDMPALATAPAPVEVADPVAATGTLTFLVCEADFVDTAAIMVDDVARRIHNVVSDLAAAPQPESSRAATPRTSSRRKSAGRRNPKPAPAESRPDSEPPESAPDDLLTPLDDD
jgi:hypothetical protein